MGRDLENSAQDNGRQTFTAMGIFHQIAAVTKVPCKTDKLTLFWLEQGKEGLPTGHALRFSKLNWRTAGGLTLHERMGNWGPRDVKRFVETVT